MDEDAKTLNDQQNSHNVDQGDGSDAQKNPDNWVTGDEPATGPQKSYVETLANDAGEEVQVDDLSKAEASKKIDELRQQSDRVQDQ